MFGKVCVDSQRSSKALWMSSSSSTFGRGLLTLCGSTLGLLIRRFDSRISTSTTRFRSGGQRESVLSMPSSRTTMPFSSELQDVQICMRRWLRWCDVHGLRFQFLCCWKGMQGVPRLWFGISKPLAIHPRHRDSGCPGSLAMEVEKHRTRGAAGTLQVLFHRIQRTNPSSGANSLTTLSLGNVNALTFSVALFRLFLHNFLQSWDFLHWFYLLFETPRSTLGSSCSPAKDHWCLIFLGDPIHWDTSVLTLESEGSFEPSMQVRRLALKCIVGIMKWHASNCEKFF